MRRLLAAIREGGCLMALVVLLYFMAHVAIFGGLYIYEPNKIVLYAEIAVVIFVLCLKVHQVFFE